MVLSRFARLAGPAAVRRSIFAGCFAATDCGCSCLAVVYCKRTHGVAMMLDQNSDFQMGAPNQRSGYQNTAWRMALAIGFLLADGHAAIAEDIYQEAPITAADREHWAYQPLVKPRLPGV